MSVVQGAIETTLSKVLESKKYTKIAVITDNNTYKHCYPNVKNILPAHINIKVKPGEENKNLDTCINVWSKLTEANFDRHSLVINLGGGVIGDMGGFCASTYKRGIEFIQIPTTLLAQVDASVGGKLGIDFQGYKNHIGVFNLPTTVLIDPSFLSTLSERETRSGFAEIIKHCLIRDRDKWDEIKIKDFDEMNWPDLINHSVSIKSKVVEADPKEGGLRKILNFGHTVGHAVETYFLNSENKILHGEAIAIGMICEAYISHKKDMLSQADLMEIEEFIYSIYGLIKIDENDLPTIAKLTLQDKKNKGNQVNASLLNEIGNCTFDQKITQSEIVKSLRYYLSK